MWDCFLFFWEDLKYLNEAFQMCSREAEPQKLNILAINKELYISSYMSPWRHALASGLPACSSPSHILMPK